MCTVDCGRTDDDDDADAVAAGTRRKSSLMSAMRLVSLAPRAAARHNTAALMARLTCVTSLSDGRCAVVATVPWLRCCCCVYHWQIINSTLGKAMGGATGGYTAGPACVVDLLRQKSRPYLFSNAVTPAVVGASLKAFELLDKDSSYVGTVRRNTHLFRTRLTEAGFTLKGDLYADSCACACDAVCVYVCA